MYHCASAAALLASASEHRSDTRVLLLITFVSSTLLSSQQHIHGMNEEDAAEDWEHELDETVQHPPAEIKDWEDLQTQIKKDLKK